MGDYYLSVQCGPKANTFRGVMFEVRGLLSGPGDAVHGEVCPLEWIYHRIDMTGNTTSGAGAGVHGGSESRRLAESDGGSVSVAALEGKNVELRLKKHTGDFSFLTLHADHPPTRLMPPWRTMTASAKRDSAIFCRLHRGNIYWLALVGGSHCSAYDLEVVELAANDTRCESGDYQLEPNEAAVSSASVELELERMEYGSCAANEYADYHVPLTFEHDSDANLRFQLELRDAVNDPNALELLVYVDGEVPISRETEFFSKHATDGIFSVTINVLEMQYRLCKATNCADDTVCKHVCAGDAAHHEARQRLLGATATAAGSGASGGSHDLVFHAAVRCGAASGQRFKLLATEIASHATDRWVHGEICPGDFVYHHWEHDEAGEYRDVRFEILKHEGDMSAMVRSAPSFAEAPMKLAPPYLEVLEGESHASIDMCGCEDAAQEHSRRHRHDGASI